MAGLYGGVEAGGTHFVCATGTGPGDLRREAVFDTTTPEETLARVAEFFRSGERPAAVGIGSFGPVELDRSSDRYGRITATPKPGWSGADVVGAVRRATGVPVGFDTDVNAAALSEHLWGAAKGVGDFVYLTVGTGIGGGVMAGGRLVHGMVHPEIGHLRVPHDRARDPFDGVCPFHGDCLEGLASGPALARRWGRPPRELPEEHPAWELEAEYLAVGVANLVCTLSPRRVVMGGGVMARPQLLPLVRRKTLELLNGYVRAPEVLEGIDSYVVSPGLGDRAGVLGAIALAQRAAASA